MGIKTRIMLLLALVVSLFAVSLFIYWRSEAYREEMLYRDKAVEMASDYERFTQLKGEGLKNFADINSRWTQMCRFVETGDRAWIRLNIDSFLPSFKLNAAWILRPDLTPVYSVELVGDNGLNGTPLRGPALAEVMKKGRFPYFFIQTKRGPMEVRGAPIQPDEDLNRTSPPRGWLFVGRLWDKELLARLTGHAYEQVSILPPGSNSQDTYYDSKRGVVWITRPLTGWDGRPVAVVNITDVAPDVAEHIALEKQVWYRFLAISALILVILYLSLTRWVTSPLAAIARSIGEENPMLIEGVRRDNTEVGRLAGLVSGFFTQRDELVREVAERKLAEQRLTEREHSLEHMAQHDGLTGLPNRILLSDRLEQALALSKRNRQGLAVLLIDLDDFKSVNDTLGHPVGDMLLQELALRLKNVLRETDTVARLGGDEFCMILPGLSNPGDADIVAVKVVEACKAPFELDGHDVRVTGSVGIAVYPFGGRDTLSLMKNADIAL